MIPLHLTLSGFLSYRDPVELDFTGFDLACIAGSNGAGKSSLLDAITWALFGQARKRDEALINAQSEAAEVKLIFQYENNVYRVQRSLPRGKTTHLEFNILQGSSEMEARESWTDLYSHLSLSGIWKVLTERSLRETQARIEQTLRLDYDTFVNASFFLQGKADQFTQQRPGDRKRILSNILGLDVWETYRERTADKRKRLEVEIAAIKARLSEIEMELGEEETRKVHLETLERELERQSKARLTQEAIVENVRKIASAMAEREKLVQALARQVDEADRRLSDWGTRLEARRQEKRGYDALLSRATAIETAYAAWQEGRIELEKWETIANQFRQQEKHRQEPLNEINALRERLMQEKEFLNNQELALENQQSAVPDLAAQLETTHTALSAIETQIIHRINLEEQLKTARLQQADAKAENPRLKAEMEELKQRIEQLESAEGANCPVCNQPLSADDRTALIDQLSRQGTGLGDRYRANQTLLRNADEWVRDLEAQIAGLSKAEIERLTHTQTIAQLTTRLETIHQAIQEWEKSGMPRLAEVITSLEKETYSPEARVLLAEIDAELKSTGYDAVAHDAARKAETDGRSIETEYHALEKGRAALVPLERELGELETQIRVQRNDAEQKRVEYNHASVSLAADQAQAPDQRAVERELLAIQEGENRLRLEVGAARQKVTVLEDLKVRRTTLESQREELARLEGRYRQLERAFGKDGVPALLIEQALPEIEDKANEILDRLSGGNMSVRFVTQAAFKDKRRDDLKETLDIQISDEVGTRDYEMFSGGEAFRVNFAIRLALSEILAQRAGARLQTLVIDEGFGSQDTMGRQRLIEAINQVRKDFAKILVITHIDELKEAFPTRIEVEKTERGSTLSVTS